MIRLVHTRHHRLSLDAFDVHVQPGDKTVSLESRTGKMCIYDGDQTSTDDMQCSGHIISMSVGNGNLVAMTSMTPIRDVALSVKRFGDPLTAWIGGDKVPTYPSVLVENSAEVVVCKLAEMPSFMPGNPKQPSLRVCKMDRYLQEVKSSVQYIPLPRDFIMYEVAFLKDYRDNRLVWAASREGSRLHDATDCFSLNLDKSTMSPLMTRPLGVEKYAFEEIIIILHDVVITKSLSDNTKIYSRWTGSLLVKHNRSPAHGIPSLRKNSFAIWSRGESVEEWELIPRAVHFMHGLGCAKSPVAIAKARPLFEIHLIRMLLITAGVIGL